MKSIFKKYRRFFLFLLFISSGIIYLFYKQLQPQKELPFYQPSQVNFELIDSTIRYVKKYHQIANFSFINQNGDTITQENYKNKIYIADFFFTTCPDICIKMTDNMKFIQDKIKNDNTVLLLSHTVTPHIDTVEQLKKYALEKGIIDSKWNLVTGSKKEIYEMARKSYLVAKENKNAGKYDLIHTENFVLVDTQKRIRGFYDGTNRKEIERLLKDISILKKENL